MKKLIFLLIVVLLFISIGAVSAEGNFTSLKNDIDSNPKSVDLTQDYVYDNNTDDQLSSGIVIDKDDFVVNGNGHTIDGSNQARIFALTGDNITLKNLESLQKENLERTSDLTSIQSEIARLKAEKRAMEESLYDDNRSYGRAA